MIDKYKDYIIESLEKKLNITLNNQKPKINPKSGVIYIIRALDSSESLYKLGKTNDIAKRIKNYQTGTADNIELLFIYETNDIDQVEKCVKVMMKE